MIRLLYAITFEPSCSNGVIVRTSYCVSIQQVDSLTKCPLPSITIHWRWLSSTPSFTQCHHLRKLRPPGKAYKWRRISGDVTVAEGHGSRAIIALFSINLHSLFYLLYSYILFNDQTHLITVTSLMKQQYFFTADFTSYSRGVMEQAPQVKMTAAGVQRTEANLCVIGNSIEEWHEKLKTLTRYKFSVV